MKGYGIIFTLFLLLAFFPSTPGAEEEGKLLREASLAADSSRTPEQRVQAIQSLGQSGDPRAVAPLLQLLKDPSEEPGIRGCAARSLGKLETGRQEVLAALEEAYRETAADDNLRYTILVSLGNMKAREALTLFREALEDPDDTIRFKAAQALGELNDPEGVQLLIGQYEREKDKTVRAEIIRALGRLQDPALEPFLSGALLKDEEALVRWNAALMLQGYSNLGPEARGALREAGKDPSPMVRQAAAGGAP
jgi:HEAT repeat protein